MRLQGETRGAYFLNGVHPRLNLTNPLFHTWADFWAVGGFCPDAKPRHSWHKIKTPTCVG